MTQGVDEDELCRDFGQDLARLGRNIWEISEKALNRVIFNRRR